MMIRHMVFSRNRYFYGHLLTASDFQAEQNYLRDKQQFRNLHTHGVGIVSGLSVTLQDLGRSLLISPGYAVDGLGREICVPAAIGSALPTACIRLLVSVSYAEIEAELTPTLTPGPLSSDNQAEYARTEEGFEVTLTPLPLNKPAGRPRILLPSQDEANISIPLAVLQRKGKRWIIEPTPRRTPTRSARTKPKKGKNK